ncbi:nucleotide exchange factor GrpE [Micromonospora sp. NPDC004704]
MSTEPASPSASLDALATEVTQLRDLFQRRLFEDRRRQELYERLYQELDFARSDLVRQFIAPICRELLLLTDRLAAARRAGTDPAVLLGSVEEEIAEVLARRGVRPIPTAGLIFDPRLHEAVGQVAVDGGDLDGYVVHERRSGHLVDDWVLRPAQVVVGRSTNGSDGG